MSEKEEKMKKLEDEEIEEVDEKELVIEEINDPGVRNPTSERTQNPNYK